MQNDSVRPGVWFAVAGLLAIVLLVVFLRENPRKPEAPPAAQTEPEPERAIAPGSAEAARSGRSREPRPATAAPAEVQDAVPYIEGLVYGDIDLREARELMPDNLYWQLGSPTKDEKVLAEREAEKKRRNEEYGRVLSGDATEEEVNAYYDYRQRLAADYVEFAEFMHRRYRDHDSDQFVGMLELALKLNAEKLAALAAEREEGLARSRERAKIREDWRRQQEEFGEIPGSGGEEPAE